MSKYQQVIATLDTFKTIGEISDELGWNKGITQHYCKRLEDLGYVEKIRKTASGNPFVFKRLVETLPSDHIKNLHNRNCLHRTQILNNNAEMNAIYNNYLFGIIRAPIAEGTKIIVDESEHLKLAHIATNELKRREIKSQRVYVGCSFGLVGW